MSQTVLEKFNALLKEYHDRPSLKFQVQPKKAPSRISSPYNRPNNQISPLPSPSKAKTIITTDQSYNIHSHRGISSVEEDESVGSATQALIDPPYTGTQTLDRSNAHEPKTIQNFNFKEYLDKQMNQQVDDAVKVFDHLRNFLPQVKYLKTKLANNKSFMMQLNKSTNAYGELSRGMGLIVDPQFCSDLEALSLKLSYQCDGDDRSMDISLQSSSPIVPKSYYLTLSSQLMSAHHDRYLPGWDGVLPTFIPALHCQCEVVVDDQESLDKEYELSYLLFPAASSEEIIQSLKKCMESYHIKSLANAKVMGGMPIVNLAALQGETTVGSFHY